MRKLMFISALGLNLLLPGGNRQAQKEDFRRLH